MSRVCDRVDAFFDGELPEPEAAAFRQHLATCDACARALRELTELEAIVGTHAEALRAAPKVVPIAAHPRWRRVLPGAGLLAVAAAVAAWLLVAPRGGPVQRGASSGAPALALVDTPSRSLEARIPYGPADRYRPYDVQRAGAASRGEHVSLEALAKLEKERDFEGVAAGMLLGGDGDRAAEALDRAGESPAADVDRAVLAWSHGRFEDALNLLARVLQREPAHEQALWDRALVLRDIHLDLAAAEAFDGVAALGEPGWAEEARARAKALRDAYDDRVRSWRATKKACVAMVASGALPPDDLVRRYPSYVTRYLYHAMRAAPSRERVLALLPLAATLDGDSGGPRVRAVQRMAAGDFGRRAPLAAEYGRLFARWIAFDFDDAAIDGFLTRTRAAREDDLFFGAVDMTGRAALNARALVSIAAARSDPWMELVAQSATAAAQQDAGDYASSETTLRAAVARCDAEHLDYLCARLEVQLVRLLAVIARTADAAQIAESGLRRSRIHAHDQGYNMEQALAEVARQRGAFPLMEAYLRDTILREPDNCTGKEGAFQLLAAARLHDFDAPGAARQIEEAPRCGEPIAPLRAMVLLELERLGVHTSEQDALSAEMDEARPHWLAGDRALIDAIQGLAVVDRDAEAGEALLRRALDQASRLPDGDAMGTKALAYARLSLALEAARQDQPEEALQQMIAHVGAAADPRCSLAVGVDYERSFAVTENAAGETAAYFDAHRPSPAIDPERLVPAAVRARLAGCPSVQVFAPAPVHGTPSLLPDDVAWSYRFGGARGASGPVPPHRLIVSDVEPPASLGLPRLQPWHDAETPAGSTWLHGAAATPERVLAELRDATEVEIHAHGMADLAVSDASLLVLSPDNAGRYALTAGDLKSARLAGHPVVVLGACSAARVAPFDHELWSLPEAFLRAGARAVFASPAAIGDADAGPFFAGVLSRVRAGADPAQALRDERVSWLARSASAWIRQVLLFD